MNEEDQIVEILEDNSACMRNQNMILDLIFELISVEKSMKNLQSKLLKRLFQ